MTNLANRLVRPEIQNLIPYSSARSLDAEGDVLLDANENPESPFNYLSSSELNRYPQPQPQALVKSLCELYGCEEANLFVGRGADEAIDTLVRTFCRPNLDQILITPPTYGFYGICAQIQGAGIVEVPLNQLDFSLNGEGVIAKATDDVKIVFLCNPNNPTGNLLSEQGIERVVEALAERALVVVDEAYIEFTKTESFVRKIEQYPNLVVLRTLSKAFGLAGVRCGVAIANPEVVRNLQKVRAPYPISGPASKIVEEVLLAAPQVVTESVEVILQNRELLQEALELSGLVSDVFPSDTNFVLVRVNNACEFINIFSEEGIIVRDRSSLTGLADCVRISVGSRLEVEQVIAVLRKNGVKK